MLSRSARQRAVATAAIQSTRVEDPSLAHQVLVGIVGRSRQPFEGAWDRVMRRYTMKQKLFFCLGDDFVIRDDDGNKVYYVDGKVLRLRQTLVIQDIDGNDLALIQKKILAIGPTYEIYRDGELAATVSKHLFTLFRCKFTVDVPGPHDFLAKGSFLEHDYSFESVTSGDTVATVSKKWVSITDSYGVEIEDDADQVLILAATVVIDMCCHEPKKGD